MTGFWGRKLSELEEEYRSSQVDRYTDILPLVEYLAQLEEDGQTASVAWATSLQAIARKIVDEWPIDPHGQEILRYVHANRHERPGQLRRCRTGAAHNHRH